MGVRTYRGEGNPFSQMVGLMREIGGERQPVVFRMGTVVSGYPSVRITVDETGRTLVSDDIILASRLTEYIRELTTGDRVIMFAYETEYGAEYVVIDKAVRL